MEFLAGDITEVSGGRFTTAITERPLPLGAVVGHGQVAVSDETEPVENDDYASFSARFADAACVGVVQVSRVAAGHPNGLALEVVRRQGRGEVGAGAAGRVPADAERGTVVPARLPTGDHRPRPPVRRRRSADGCLSGVGLGQNEGFVYQARAFLEEVAGIEEASSLPRAPRSAKASTTWRSWPRSRSRRLTVGQRSRSIHSPPLDSRWPDEVRRLQRDPQGRHGRISPETQRRLYGAGR